MSRAGSVRSWGGSGPASWGGGEGPLGGGPARLAAPNLRRAEPHGRVHVAEAARRLLDVRFADVRRRAVFAVTGVAFHQRRLEELAEVTAEHVLAQHPLETREQAPLRREEARLLHRRAAPEVPARHRDADRHRAEALADVEPEVPEGIEQLLHHPLHV